MVRMSPKNTLVMNKNSKFTLKCTQFTLKVLARKRIQKWHTFGEERKFRLLLQGSKHVSGKDGVAMDTH